VSQVVQRVVTALGDGDEFSPRGGGVLGTGSGDRADRVVSAVEAEDRLCHRTEVGQLSPADRDRLVQRTTAQPGTGQPSAMCGHAVLVSSS
jgi:hypothetical protein